MGQFDHPNVIRLIGVVTRSEWRTDKSVTRVFSYLQNWNMLLFILTQNFKVELFAMPLGRPMMILTEFLKSGSLDHYLKVPF